jgi:TolB-like protein/DNA-binding winged helix-turn-helix (wHTH) protein
MNRPNPTILRIGDWRVDPTSGEISRIGETQRLEVRTMRLLLCLAERPGEVVSIDELLNRVWPDANVASDSVYQAVASLRRVLGDDSKQPTYVETIPRLGYRMVAAAGPWVGPSPAQNGAQVNALTSSTQQAEIGPSAPQDVPAPGLRKASGPRARAGFALAVAVTLGMALIVVFLTHGKTASNNPSASSAIAAQPQKSIAVLPFLDLTDEMNEEPFADGMTEELIDKLSKIPGLRVPPPTSSFYYKGKLWPHAHGTPQITIAEIAKALNVVYVLDGSVRKSGGRVRVAARLIRADNGFVVWSETYDRPLDDILMVQDEIAGEVTKALKASI